MGGAQIRDRRAGRRMLVELDRAQPRREKVADRPDGEHCDESGPAPRIAPHRRHGLEDAPHPERPGRIVAPVRVVQLAEVWHVEHDWIICPRPRLVL